MLNQLCERLCGRELPDGYVIEISFMDSVELTLYDQDGLTLDNGPDDGEETADECLERLLDVAKRHDKLPSPNDDD